MIRRVVTVVGLIAVAGFAILRIVNMNSKPSTALGIHNGQLADCPSTPNCVSSFATDDTHGIAPIDFAESNDAAWEILVDVMKRFPKTRIVESNPEKGYLRCECRTPIASYVDDVEFLLDEDGNVIHVRSASRLGYSDMNANRNRIELVRKRFQEAYSISQ